MRRFRQRFIKASKLVGWIWLYTLLGGTFISYLFPAVYVSELFCHFRLQHVICLCAAIIILWKNSRWIIFSLTLIGLTANFLPLFSLVGKIPVENQRESLTLCSINVLSYSQTYEKVITYLEKEDPEVVVLIEMNERWKVALDSLRLTYPYVVDASAEGNYGMMLFSKLPFEWERIEYLGPMQSPMIVVRLLAGVTVAGVHFRSPDLYEKFLARNHTYQTVGNRKKQYPEPYIFMGDFNTTTYSVYLQEFVQKMELVDSRKGRGLYSSWPSLFFPLWVPIDHAFVSEGLGVVRRETGGYLGSDHLPILLEVLTPDF
ncbi:MAG: endonuclease/exonuclease/phosphatase family protein [Bacteroidota bacterium]